MLVRTWTGPPTIEPWTDTGRRNRRTDRCLTGAAAVLAFRVSRARSSDSMSPHAELRMSRCSPQAPPTCSRCCGNGHSPRLRRRHRAVEPVRASVRSRAWRSARRVGTHRAGPARAPQRRDPQADFDIPRGPLGGGTFAVSARVAPVGRSRARPRRGPPRPGGSTPCGATSSPTSAMSSRRRSGRWPCSRKPAGGAAGPGCRTTLCRPHAAGIAAPVGAGPGPDRPVPAGGERPACACGSRQHRPRRHEGSGSAA